VSKDSMIESLRQQCNAQLAELEAISAALGTNEGHSSVTHILDLRQQLAAALNKLEMAETCLADDNALIAGLKNDLAAAIAACKLKDAAIKDLLEFATYSTCGKAHAVEAAKEALTIQPDDSTLKAWVSKRIASTFRKKK